MNGQLVSMCIAIFGVPAVLLGWTIAAHNVRVWRVRKLARSLPVGTREQILARIVESARGSSVCTLLVPANSPRDESQSAIAFRLDLTASRFGGPPYGEPGEQWPTRDDDRTQPADFLIQVRLDDPLPSPWLGRLIVVFLKFDVTQAILVYAAPSPAKYARRPGSPDASLDCGLMSLPIPKAKPPVTHHLPEQVAAAESPAESPGSENAWQLPYDPALLLELVPGLREELRQFTRRPADLLAQLMAPEHYGYGFDLSDIVQMGGGPQWVQDNPGPMTCPECGHPMRFLFQFGDLSGRNRLGDAGICYVFGCDAHPDSTQSLVQMC